MSTDHLIQFNNGYHCPILGLGTWKANPGEVTQCVKDAIDIGYRHFDCAYLYENEFEIGKGIQEKINEGVVKREDLFITSKDINDNLWPMGENGVYLTSDVDFTGTWKGMEECVDSNLTKSIGISNFNSKQIDTVLEIADIKPVNNQVECHPHLNQKKLIEFCQAKNVTVTSYRPLGGVDGIEQVLGDPVLKEIAEQHNKSTAQIAIRYQIQRNICAVPKSIRKTRLEENFDVLNFSLTNEDMSKIDKLDKNHRFVTFSGLSHHKHYPFLLEF